MRAVVPATVVTAPARPIRTEPNPRVLFGLGVRTPSVSVVIPAMNEALNLPWVLERLPNSVHEVVLVDGNSQDDTVAVAMAGHAGVRIVGQHAPGKGAALAAGLLAARGDIVVMIDADGSMDPTEIPGLVGALLAGADVAKGSRFVVGGGSADLTALRSAGNRALTYLGRILYGQRWSELCYGLAAFWSDAIPRLGLDEIAGLPLTPRSAEEELAGLIVAQAPPKRRSLGYGHGFEIETILFTRATRAGMRVTEVASYEHERLHGNSKLRTFRDGWRVLKSLFRERLRRPTTTLVCPEPAEFTEPLAVTEDALAG